MTEAKAKTKRPARQEKDIIPESNAPERERSFILSPIKILQLAAAKVPAVNYALGLAGIAAAGAIIVGFLGSGKSSIVIVALTFIGALLLFVFSRLTLSSKQSTQSAGGALIWATVAFFCTFMFFTVTAFAFNWPTSWVRFLGIQQAHASIAECDKKTQKMWSQFNNPLDQTSDALKIAHEIVTCNPFQSYVMQGAASFYKGDFYEAANFFERAHAIDPTNDTQIRNLADSYVELGRPEDAITTYNKISIKSTPLWNYKMGRALIYNRRYAEARNLLSRIKTEFGEDGNNPGKARILEAAAIVGAAQSVQNPEEKRDALLQAENIFKRGIGEDVESWKKILKAGKTKHEGFQISVELLKPHIETWLQTAIASQRL